MHYCTLKGRSYKSPRTDFKEGFWRTQAASSSKILSLSIPRANIIAHLLQHACDNLIKKYMKQLSFYLIMNTVICEYFLEVYPKIKSVQNPVCVKIQKRKSVILHKDFEVICFLLWKDIRIF